MKYKHLLCACLLLFSALQSTGQEIKYIYYFDKDLNIVTDSNALFYGNGETQGDLFRLMLFNNHDKHLIMIQHFTDSSLQVSEGLFTSYYANNVKESEGNYHNRQQDDWWQKWDSSGTLIDSSLYQNGQLLMKSVFVYYPDKKLKDILTSDFKNQKFITVSYDESGNIIPVIIPKDEDIVFTKTEIEAMFPGGEHAWKTYIKKQVSASSSSFDENNAVTCRIRFIVNKSGDVSEIKVLAGDADLSAIIVKAIKKGPKWIPAQQNGRNVTAYKIITVTYP